MTSYLIPYKRLKGHEDPMLIEYTYGHDKNRGKMLRERVKKGDYLFFHTHRRGKDVLTGYYQVEMVIPTEEVQKDERLKNKYQNPHITSKISSWDTMAFGNTIYSYILQHPMAITKDMLAKFSRPPKGIIRPWIKISEQDIGLLLRLIKEYEEQGFLKDAVISSSEVEQLQEQDVESFIWEHPTKLGKYQPLERQYDLKSGNRVDLILRGDDGLLIIEVKKSSIGREAYKQLNGYLDEIMQDKKYGQDAKLGINGAIICEDIMPAFEDFYQKLIDTKKIIVYLYGWRFNLNSYGQ